jgi:heptosyltransferase-2
LKNILIIQTAFIGDVILALPLADALKERYPQANIHFLVCQGRQNLLENHPAISNIWVWEKKKRKWKNWFKLLKALRQIPFDLVINLQRHFATGLLCANLITQEIRGFSQNPFSFLYSFKLPYRLANKQALNYVHEVERNLSLLQGVCSTRKRAPRLFPAAQDYERVEPFYALRPFIVVAPASIWYTKQLPIEQWKEFLAQTPLDFHIFLIGAKEDQPLGLKLQKARPAVTNLIGELSLLQSAALIEKSERVFANDSAPLHLASAMQTPATAIFTSTTPNFGFGPLSPGSVIVETQEILSCRPCGKHGKRKCPQGHFRCARSITPQQLLATLALEKSK